MVTKNQVDKLLEKNLTPKEVARLIIEDAEEAVRKKTATSSIEDELTLSEADTNRLMKNQTQKEAYKTGQWLQAWKSIGMNEARAQIEGLEAIEAIQGLTTRVRQINLASSFYMDERSYPALMTQKEYEEKRQALWEHESSEQIPVAEAVRAKADLLYEQETGDYPGRDEEIPEEIYDQAQEWILGLVKQDKLEPKKLEEPIVKDEYEFDTKEDLNIDDWPFKWYFTQGELAEVEDSPFSYIKEFDPQRYSDKLAEEHKTYFFTEIAVVQNPIDQHIDERGWYKGSESSYEALRESLEEVDQDLIRDDKDIDSLQQFYDVIRERGIKNHLAYFKTHKKLASHFYRALGLEIESSKGEVEMTRERIWARLRQYERELDKMKWHKDKAIWHLSSGEEVEFKSVDYESIEPSQVRLREWGQELDKYFGPDWMDKDPEGVVINV